MLRRLGVIGAGGMAATMLEALAQELPLPLDHLSVLVRPDARETGEALVERYSGRVATVCVARETLAEFAADRLDLVAECAGHDAVRDYGPTLLANASDLMVVSVGSLADDALRQELETAALRSGAQLLVPPGAIGGIDVLAAVKLAGLDSVTYIGRKPPHAWRGTPAERTLDLDTLTEAVIFYEGTARQAARDYPQNANVAATVALAGAGFDETQVQLVADPAASRNVHEVSVRSACADFTIRLEGRPSLDNPKSSLTAGYSMARAVLNRLAPVEI